MSDDIRFWDAFAGIGGFRKGFEEASQRFKCVGGCEWEQSPRYVYHKRFGGYLLKDITTIDEKYIPDHDVLTGGFPCQAFSHAGKRLGFEDTRGTLFFDLCRIAKAKRPRLLLFENVDGLRSHDKGRTFWTILTTLDELGYDAEWQIINSKHFVPQKRPRIFIIGHLREKPTPQIFPLPQSKEVSDTQDRGKQEGKQRLWGEVSTIDTRYGALRNAGETYLIYSDTEKEIQEGDKIRRLTPLECERLQGFPDNWTQGLPDTERYHCIGNAVTVPVIKEIAKRILDVW